MVSVLRLRFGRIQAQGRLAEARQAADTDDPGHRGGRESVRELRALAVEAKEKEDATRAEIDARLLAHRADPARPKLGLDVICDEHGLGPEERILLLAATVPGIGKPVMDTLLGEAGPWRGSLAVGDLIRILDPIGVDGCLQARLHFHPTRPLLVGNRLLILSWPRLAMADAILESAVQVNRGVFARVVGVPEIATEGPAPEADEQVFEAQRALAQLGTAEAIASLKVRRVAQLVMRLRDAVAEEK